MPECPIRPPACWQIYESHSFYCRLLLCEGAAEFFSKIAECEDTLKFEPREFIVQGDKVVVVGHYEARAKATGREYATYFIHVFTVREGKITSFVEYTDTAAIAEAFVKIQNA